MSAGQTYTPTNNGWYVPDARMIEIMDQLKDKLPK